MPVQLIRGSSGGGGRGGGGTSKWENFVRFALEAQQMRLENEIKLRQEARDQEQEEALQELNAGQFEHWYKSLEPELQPEGELLWGMASELDPDEAIKRQAGIELRNKAFRVEKFRQQSAERILRLAENAGGEQEIPELVEIAEGVAQGFTDPQKGVQQAEKFAAAAAQKQAFEIRRQEGIAMLDGMRQIVPQVSQQLASIAALGTADPDLGFDEMIGMAGKAMAKYAERLRDDGDPTTDPKSMDPGFEAMRRHMAGQEVPPVPMPQAVTDPGAPAPQGDPVDVPNQLPKDSIPQDGSPEVEQFQASPQAQELQAAGAQAAARGGFDEWVASMGYPNRDAVPDWLLEAIADQIINLPGRTPEEYGDAEKVEYSLHGDVSGEQMRRALHGGS